MFWTGYKPEMFQTWEQIEMTCPNCGGDKIVGLVRTDRDPDPSLPDVVFIDIAFKCEICEFTFNCVGAKSINNTK